MNPRLKKDKDRTVQPGTVDATRCDYCQRHLTSESEWIRGDRHLICEDCYRNFLNPGRNSLQWEID